MYLPFGTPATNRGEFRDYRVHKFITSILWGHCHAENAMWVYREKHPEKSTPSWVKTLERKIIRTEQLKKEKVILHGTNCWVSSRALFGAHSSPRQELMNSHQSPMPAAQPLAKISFAEQDTTCCKTGQVQYSLTKRAPTLCCCCLQYKSPAQGFYPSCHSLSQKAEPRIHQHSQP